MKNHIRMEQFADGSINEVEVELEGESHSLIVLRQGDSLRAWFNVCPHAGRRLDYAPGEFLQTATGLLMCAVHGATFSLEDGACVGGPCLGASLASVPVTVTEAGGVVFGAGAATHVDMVKAAR